MIVAIVILLIVCIVLCWGGVFCQNDDLRRILCLITGILLLIISSLLATYFQNTPTAMDVYRGDTTLQYTVVDGQNVDSTVVFRDTK